MIGCYRKKVTKRLGMKGAVAHQPRSRRETLLLFWLETGRTSFSFA